MRKEEKEYLSLKEHLKNIPTYSYLNKKGKRSWYRYGKFRIADFLMGGCLMNTIDWFNKGLELAKIEKEKLIKDIFGDHEER